MTSLPKKRNRRNEGRDTEFEANKEYSIKEYDDTFSLTLTILKRVGLRLTRNDTDYVRKVWEIFLWFEFANMFAVFFLEFIAMVLQGQGGSFKDALEIFTMMPCAGYALLSMAKPYNVARCRPIFENLISELRSMWPEGSITDEEYAIIGKALKQLRFVTKGYYWCNNTLLVMGLYPPCLDVLKRLMGQDVPYRFLLAYWLPFNGHQHIYFEIVFSIQIWHAIAGIWLITCSDLLFCIFLTHITMQFDLLSLRIRRLVYVPVDRQLVATYPLGEFSQKYRQQHREEIDAFNDKDWHAKHERELAEIILRHRALIRLSGDVENMFSFSLLMSFFESSIIICFSGFCVIMVEKLHETMYKSFLITALSQTWLLCWYGQRLLESSEGVSDALYESGWYKTSQRGKRSILIMLHRAQKRVGVTTYGFSFVSLSSYTTIIKTSWSYFTLLLNVYKR